MVNKKNIVELCVNKLKKEIENINDIIAEEQLILNDAPHAMQSWSDTTRSQKEDLLVGLNKQLKSKNEALHLLQSIKIEKVDYITTGSMICLNENNKFIYCFVLPGVAGETVEIDGLEISIISPLSVIAKSLSGHKIGEYIEIKVPAGIRKLLVVSIE